MAAVSHANLPAQRRSARLAARSEAHPQDHSSFTPDLPGATPAVQTDTKPKDKPAARRTQRAAKPLPTRHAEALLWDAGFRHVAGVDEVGRGPLAGPVVAAACCLPANLTIEGINDSKKLTAHRRELLSAELLANPSILTSIQVIEPAVIDSINILQATMQAMQQAVQRLRPLPDFVLIDGTQLPRGLDPATCQAITGGDSRCVAIAAASILAKVFRDRLMMEYHDAYPQYGFADHKGYGTPKHLQALKQHGPCPIHRMSFAPCAAAALQHGTEATTAVIDEHHPS